MDHRPRPRRPEVVPAPAKLTRSLRVTGVRADGYHLIDAEMVSLDLADTAHLRRRRRPGGREASAPRCRPATTTSSRERCGPSGAVAHVTVDKRIPAGAGLGGGSADAAAVLRWAGVDDLELAVRLGADVPFCLVGGRARVTGHRRGGGATALRTADLHAPHAAGALLDASGVPGLGRPRRPDRSTVPTTWNPRRWPSRPELAEWRGPPRRRHRPDPDARRQRQHLVRGGRLRRRATSSSSTPSTSQRGESLARDRGRSAIRTSTASDDQPT